MNKYTKSKIVKQTLYCRESTYELIELDDFIKDVMEAMTKEYPKSKETQNFDFYPTDLNGKLFSVFTFECFGMVGHYYFFTDDINDAKQIHERVLSYPDKTPDYITVITHDGLSNNIKSRSNILKYVEKTNCECQNYFIFRDIISKVPVLESGDRVFVLHNNDGHRLFQVIMEGKRTEEEI